MAGSSRRGNYQEDMCWEEIESDEDDDDYRLTLSLDDNIEEEEEDDAQESGKGSVSSSNGYPPLNVKRFRVKKKLTINHERTLSIGRKTVLYGQTPAAICRKQLQAMADFNGMSLKEFATQVATGSTFDNLNLLRRFHTHGQPELASLFEEVEKCVVPVGRDASYRGEAAISEWASPASSNSNILRGEYSAGSNPDVHMESKDSSADKVIYGTDSDESFSHLVPGYSNRATMCVHSLGDLGSDSQRQKGMKKNRARRSEILSRTPSKTVVSETESDSEELPSPKDCRAILSVSLSPRHINEDAQQASNGADSIYQGRAFRENGNALRRSSLPSSVSSNVFDPLIGRERTAESVECSDEAVTVIEGKASIIEGKDYNNFLDSLLFEGDPEVCRNTSARCCGVVNRDIRGRKSISSTDERSKATYRQNRNCNLDGNVQENSSDTGIIRQSSGSYNRVLGNLLFDESCSPLQSGSRGSEQRLENVDNNARNSSAESHHSSIVAGGSSTNDALLALFDSPCDSVVPGNGKREDKSSETAGDGGQELPSSLELSASLWDTLDHT